LDGEYGAVFPYALREENYDKIRRNLDNIEFRKVSIEQFVAEYDGTINAFNLSDIFEYMTQAGMDVLYETMLQHAASGARFVYWNMLAPRRCSDALCQKYNVATDDARNGVYLQRDKAFFYSAFYLDTVQ
jgi:S-adenosylmethionine-diacylglycerol 3-amino-3-carboxypropyl transferase